MPGVLERSHVAVNPLLTEFGVKYTPQGHIGRGVFPTVNVKSLTGVYPTWDKSHWFRLRDTLVSMGEAARFSIFGMNLDSSFTCKLQKWAVRVPQLLIDISESELDLQKNATEFATNVVDLRYEYDIAAAVTTSGNWTNSLDVSSTAYWSDETNGTPLTDMDTAIEAVRKATGGYRPNVCAFGPQPWLRFIRHPQVIDAVYAGGDTGGKMANEALIAARFGLDKVLVGGGMYTTDEEGTAEASVGYTDMWGNNCWLGYVAPNRNLMAPSAGWTLRYRYAVRSWFETSPECSVVECQDIGVPKVVAADAGYLFYNCDENYS